jgi:hypothetical protein
MIRGDRAENRETAASHMPVIRMDALAEAYAKYSFTANEQDKDSILTEGIESILLRLRRYMRSPEKFTVKSRQALKELEAVLERFYYQDSKFSKLIHAKAQLHVQKNTVLLKERGT